MTERPEYLCQRADSPIPIDGDLSKPAWQAAVPVRLLEAAGGGPTQQATISRMLYDDEFLYIGFEVQDHTIIATMTERDDPVCGEEAVEAFLSPLGRTDVYYEIEVSPTGVIFDLLVLNPDPTQSSGQTILGLAQWDCRGMQVGIQVDGEVNGPPGESRSWSVEMALPLAELIGAPNLPPKPGDRWRMNLFRIDRAASGDEFQAWSPTGRVNYHISDRFGTLVFG